MFIGHMGTITIALTLFIAIIASIAFGYLESLQLDSHCKLRCRLQGASLFWQVLNPLHNILRPLTHHNYAGTSDLLLNSTGTVLCSFHAVPTSTGKGHGSHHL